MAVDFKAFETRLVSTPERLRRAARRPPAPPVLAPSPVIVLPSVPPGPDPAAQLTVAAVTSSPATVRVDDVPATNYWVRRRRAQAQASDQA